MNTPGSRPDDPRSSEPRSSEHCPDGSGLVSLLYDDFEPDARLTRTELVRHVRDCEVCAAEFTALGGVREQLSAWTTPAAAPGFEVVRTPARVLGWRRRLASVATWSQRTLPLAAAATLVLGAALSLARLDVRYDASGLQVRTGWGHGSPTTTVATDPGLVLTPVSGTAPTPGGSGPASGELDALRRQVAAMTDKLQALEGASASRVAATTVGDDGPVAARTGAPVNDTAILRRIQQLIEESEVRQQQNLQLRIGEITRDFELQRRADLVQIEQGFGKIDNQRQQMLNMFRQVSTGSQVPER